MFMGHPIFLEVSFITLSLLYLFLSFLPSRKKVTQVLIYTSIIIFILFLTYFLVQFNVLEYKVGSFFQQTKLTIASKSFVLFLSILLLSLLLGGLSWQDVFFAKVESLVLFLLSLAGGFFMLSACDFLSLYLGMELQSISLYTLLAFRTNKLLKSEAAVKYFVLSAIASGIFLYGITFIYGATGDTHYFVVHEAFNNILSAKVTETPISYIGMILVLGGLFFKVSLVPFHMWTPDIYRNAPILIVVLLATISKVFAVTVVLNLLIGPFRVLASQWETIFLVLGALSIGVGTLSALAQKSIMRLLGFSSIAHMGFIALSLGTGSSRGIENTYVYLFLYVLSTLGTFSLLIEAKYRLKRIGKKFQNLTDLAGFSRIAPGWSFMLAIFLFSLAGLPPLAGFFAKFYIMMALVDRELMGYAVVALIFTILGAVYYVRLAKIMYLDQPKDIEFAFSDFYFKTFVFFRIPSFLCLCFTLFYIIFPDLLLAFSVFIFE